MAEFGPPLDDLVEHTTPAKDCVCGPMKVEAQGVHPSGVFATRIGDVWIHRRLDEDARK